MNPKVSVIIPTYNRPQFLQEAILSVRSQTYQNIEILVIDDGSTDPEVEAVVRPFLSEVTYVKKENGGPGSAVNEGLKLATGIYIVRLDDDDLMLPEKIERQVAYMEAHPEFGLSAHNAINVLRDGRTWVSHSNFGGWDKYGQLIGLLLECPFCQPTVMVRKTAYDAVGEYTTDVIPDDWDMWIRLVKAGLCAKSALPNKKVELEELEREIKWAITQLSIKQKQAFILRHYEGLTLKEIAKAMECQLGTVKAHLFHAAHRLRRILTPYLYGR